MANAVVVLNRFDDLKAGQTSALMVAELASRREDVFVCGVDDLALGSDDRVRLRGHRIEGSPDAGALCEGLRSQRFAVEELRLRAGDLVVLRTNPARDGQRSGAHETALHLASWAAQQGAVVLNDPDGLRRAASKLYLARLPVEFRPPTLVARRFEVIQEFLRALDGPAVLKPLRGTRGEDVFKVSGPGGENLRQIVDVLTRGGNHAMVQGFIPQAVDGDVRLVLVDGQLLEIDGEVAAVRRRPSGDDFRSNVHVGGRPEAVQVDAQLRAVAQAAGPILAEDGIFIAGLDVIGGKVVEINVFSSGGLGDAQEFYERPFVEALIDKLERRWLGN